MRFVQRRGPTRKKLGVAEIRGSRQRIDLRRSWPSARFGRVAEKGGQGLTRDG